MPTESQKLDILSLDCAPSTRRHYQSSLKTIQETLDGSVELATMGQLLYFLNRVTNPHTRGTYINIIAKLRPDLKQDMMAIRNQNKKLTATHISHTNSLSNKPTYAQLCAVRDQAYAEGRWADFLVQALTLLIGCRTNDLKMQIEDVESRDTTKNHLVRYAGSVELIRNCYKTVRTYRRQRHQIADPRIVHAAYQLPAGSFTRKICDCEPKGVNQSDYFRAQIEHLVAHDPHVLSKIQSLCQSRGSSFTEVASSYNLRST